MPISCVKDARCITRFKVQCTFILKIIANTVSKIDRSIPWLKEKYVYRLTNLAAHGVPIITIWHRARCKVGVTDPAPVMSKEFFQVKSLVFVSLMALNWQKIRTYFLDNYKVSMLSMFLLQRPLGRGCCFICSKMKFYEYD